MERTKKDLLSRKSERRTKRGSIRILLYVHDSSDFLKLYFKIPEQMALLDLIIRFKIRYISFVILLCNFCANKCIKKDKSPVSNQPVATERTSTVLSLMIGLKICLVSAVPARFLLWHLRIRRSSCFCSRTRMSSRRSVYSSEWKHNVIKY